MRLAQAAALLLLLSAACGRDKGAVKPGSFVKFDYELTADGKVFETTRGNGPVEINQGSGDVPPGVDLALLGMRAGERGTFELPAGVGFGPHDPAKVETLSLAAMGAMGADVKPGKKIMGFKDGKPVEGRVLEVRDGAARVDFNHPLAGKALRYSVRIVAVDPAR